MQNEKCQQMQDLRMSLASEKGKNASQVLTESILQEEIETLNEIIKSKRVSTLFYFLTIKL